MRPGGEIADAGAQNPPPQVCRFESGLGTSLIALVQSLDTRSFVLRWETAGTGPICLHAGASFCVHTRHLARELPGTRRPAAYLICCPCSPNPSTKRNATDPADHQSLHAVPAWACSVPSSFFRLAFQNWFELWPLASGNFHALAGVQLRLPAWRRDTPLLQHAGLVDVRL